MVLVQFNLGTGFGLVPSLVRFAVQFCLVRGFALFGCVGVRLEPG